MEEYHSIKSTEAAKKNDLFCITIIIPTYKPNNYLHECLSSIAKQSIDIRKVEILILLNGDKHPYLAIINGYIEQFAEMNIKFYYIASKGVSNARNFGLEIAKAKFITFIDDDDLISKSYLTELHDLRHDEFMATNMKAFYATKQHEELQLKSDYVTRCYERNYTSSQFNLFMYRQFFSSACGKIIPRKLIGDTRFDPELENGEDSLFMFCISKRVKNIKLSDPDSCYMRRLRTDSVSKKERSFLYHLSNTLRLIYKYSEVFLKERKSYSTNLYLSRIIATIIKLVRKTIKDLK